MPLNAIGDPCNGGGRNTDRSDQPAENVEDIYAAVDEFNGYRWQVRGEIGGRPGPHENDRPGDFPGTFPPGLNRIGNSCCRGCVQVSVVHAGVRFDSAMRFQAILSRHDFRGRGFLSRADFLIDEVHHDQCE